MAQPPAPTCNAGMPSDKAEAGPERGEPAVHAGESSTAGQPAVQVYSPPASSTPVVPEVDDDFFEPTVNDVRAHHASVLARSHQLNDAPLLTGRYRDSDRANKEKKKADKWPNTTIRVKFSDGTIIQSVFPSSSPIQPVYAFVRSALDESAASLPFLLWQPPRVHYPETPVPEPKKKPKTSHIVTAASYGPVKGSTTAGLQSGTGRNETLSQLGLVPQSILLIKFEKEELNTSGAKPPLKPELLASSQPLPAPAPRTLSDVRNPSSSSSNTGGKTVGGAAGGENKVPKWLQKGLLKKK